MCIACVHSTGLLSLSLSLTIQGTHCSARTELHNSLVLLLQMIFIESIPYPNNKFNNKTISDKRSERLFQNAIINEALLKSDRLIQFSTLGLV